MNFLKIKTLKNHRRSKALYFIDALLTKKVAGTLIFLGTVCGYGADVPQAALVPKLVNVTSSQPRVELWETLTDKEKQLADHLIRAAEAGRPLLFNQEHRPAIVMHKLFSAALSAKNIKKTQKLLGATMGEFVRYATIFED